MIGLPTLRALDGAQSARMETAAKPETAIDKGMAGPGLLAYIVTSKFSDYLPLYRLEDIFERQGFEISRATQSVWCGDVADLVEPLYELMAERVRASHVVATLDRGATDQSIFPRITDRFCWPMPTAGTTASWQATRLRAPDAGRTCVAA
jgi:hypothetical protein